MLRIPIVSIGDNGHHANLQVEAADLPLLASESVAGEIAFVGPIAVRLSAFRHGKTIDIHGRIHYSGRIRCCRCLASYELRVDSDFTTTAMPAEENAAAGDGRNEIELDADDMNVMEYHGETIDLRDEIAQQIVMTLPVKPLCDSACKGLCSRCGANLNRQPCTCTQTDDGNPFAVLQTLSFSDSAE